MSVTLAEFERQVAQHIERTDEGTACNFAALYDLVRESPLIASVFITCRFKARGEELMRAIAVTATYQMVTGDGSFWSQLEKQSEEQSYVQYEQLFVGTPYSRCDFWKPNEARIRAREHWLVSGRDDAICDDCRAPLKRGSGFLVHIGVDPLSQPGIPGLSINYGDAFFCGKCFETRRSGEPVRKPLTAEEWPSADGYSEESSHFLHNRAPAKSPESLISAIQDDSPSLNALHAWTREYCPLSARPDAVDRETVRANMDSWVSWEEKLRNEAVRAIELCDVDPNRAYLVGRAVLMLTSLIPPRAFKEGTLLELSALFSRLDRTFELTEVYSQLCVPFAEEQSSNEVIERDMKLLRIRTQTLHRADLYDEALVSAFEWLTASVQSGDRESSREPRYWVARSLYGLGKWELTQQALEANGAKLFSWLQFGQASSDDSLRSSKTRLTSLMWDQGLLYGLALKANGQLARAIEVLSRLVAQTPESVEPMGLAFAYSELGYASGQAGFYDNAATWLRKAAKIALSVGSDSLAEKWSSSASSFDDDIKQNNIYDPFPSDDQFIQSLRTQEHAARAAIDQLTLANCLSSLALALINSNLRAAFRCFEESVAILEGLGHHTTQLRVHTYFSGLLLTTGRVNECSAVLGRAQQLYTALRSKNVDSATRQELAKIAFDVFDIGIELMSHGGKWLEVLCFGERYRAPNLSRWIRIASLAHDKSNNWLLRSSIQQFRSAEVEAEIRHLTGSADGESLLRLDSSRKYHRDTAAFQLEQSGVSASILDSDSFEGTELAAQLLAACEPGVGILFLFSCRRRFTWVLASADPESGQLIVSGARPDDKSLAGTDVPRFLDWPYEKRAAVAELAQRQLGAPEEEQFVKSQSVPAELQARMLWEVELACIGEAVEKRGVKRLIVIPQRELALMPLWGLADQCNLDAIRVAPSLSVAVDCHSRKRPVNGLTLTVSDVTGTLLFAQQELEMVASTRKKAGTVSAVKSFASLVNDAPNCSVLHVAAHGCFHAPNPYETGFAIDPEEDEKDYFVRFTPPDGFAPSPEYAPGSLRLLTVASVMAQVPLDRCRLVMLSTCESGIPRLHDGGEMTGLPNAFLVSGAQSVIASLWKVDDQATYLLMRYFYETWSDGDGSARTPSEALAAARKKLRLTDCETARQLLGPTATIPFGDFPFSDPTYSDAFHCYGGW